MTVSPPDSRQHEASLSKIRVPSDLLNPPGRNVAVCAECTALKGFWGDGGSSPFTAAFPDQWAYRGCGYRCMMAGMAASLSGTLSLLNRL